MADTGRPIVRLPLWSGAEDVEPLLTREWLVTNGMGGYASGTVAGLNTRRYHGALVAALPAPLGRNVMLAQLWDTLEVTGHEPVSLGAHEAGTAAAARLALARAAHLHEFRLEAGLPVWTFAVHGWRIELRVFMPYRQNTTFFWYRALGGPAGRVTLRLRPAVQFRGYEDPVSTPLYADYQCSWSEGRGEIAGAAAFPRLRLRASSARTAFRAEPEVHREAYFRVEAGRGYEAVGDLWSPGELRAELSAGEDVALIASIEAWDRVAALTPAEAHAAELSRREHLLEQAGTCHDPVAAELTLAADQFVIAPAGRTTRRARGGEEEVRTVIAGYHWFTDWGRDTMIALEGLTITTGRAGEAALILRTFAQYVRAGLIPNMFPDGSTEGLYHTADATLWFFHALHRYTRGTRDPRLVRELLPVLRDIVAHHLRGTEYGIGVDPEDGLLRQGAPGYQLTWMDAKVDDWVVTPRRGKAVEINALWYNALMLLAEWEDEHGERADAQRWREQAARTHASFNQRFWYGGGGYLFDVVDGEAGDDAACRPNQVFAISLDHPVLERRHWSAVMDVVHSRLLTPVGLRSLAPGHPDYKPRYDGDLYARDAAYHQGTVWGWLIGPFIDAWLRAHPHDLATGRQALQGLVDHLDEFGVGSIAEVFDAEPPFTPRGCIAQAWSVAETLRCWVRLGRTEGRPTHENAGRS